MPAYAYLRRQKSKHCKNMTYEEAKEMALSMPEVATRGPQYVEEFVQGFLEAMNSGEPLGGRKAEA